MERVEYLLEKPWPSLPTLNEICCSKSFPTVCRENEISRELGKPSSTGDDCTTEPVDYYFDGIEFTTIEKLEKDLVQKAGTFAVLRSDDFYVLLRDRTEMPTSRSPTRLKQKARAKKTPAAENSQLCMRQITLTPPRGPEEPSRSQPKTKKAEPRKPKQVPEKQMDVSLTVGQVGADVPGEVFNKVALYIEKRASMGVIAFKRGDTNLKLHIQGVMSINGSSVLTKAIGWDTDAPVGGVVCIRRCIREMVRSGQYLAGLKWLLVHSVSKVRAERLWMAAVQPEAVSMADIDHIFFNFEEPDPRGSNCS
ncbi:hypothetical protein R1sor_003929 [Riccia sorocarpa]|uniref:Uncharacterized protein n=1 Tax=Riccia sorocarpa TaxID=122646 RepID=A0ABD3H323_9MARC